MIESEFKGVRKHSGSPCHTTDQWSTQLFMCSNWLAVLPHSDYSGDVLDHGHKNRTLEICGNIITGDQAEEPLLCSNTPWHLLIPKQLMRPHTSLRHIFSMHTCTCTETPINDWFSQLAVSFYWRNAKEDFCSVLISERDISDDFGHSPDQKGSAHGQKKSQRMHSEADVTVSTTLHC